MTEGINQEFDEECIYFFLRTTYNKLEKKNFRIGQEYKYEVRFKFQYASNILKARTINWFCVTF